MMNDAEAVDLDTIRPWTLSAEETLSRTRTDESSGLPEQDVVSRRIRFGLNLLAESPPPPIWKKLTAQFQELVIWILIVAAILAGWMGEWIDTIAILAIVILNGTLGFIQEEKASRALAALRAMSSPMAKALRDGTIKSIPARELVPGDVIQLEAGDHVPADARLVKAWSVSAQEASLTGESVPVDKNAAIVLQSDASIADRRNSVFMGAVITSGKATAVVTAIGMNTELGRIAGMLDIDESEPTPLQRRLAELGRILVVVCLVLVGLIFSIQYLRGGELFETLLVAVSLAVAAVPEGLPAVVTIALALGLQRMAKRNALVRKLPSVETLGSVTVICSDKTGTLTRNEMTVREIIAGGKHFQVSGSGYEPRGGFVPVTNEQNGHHATPTQNNDLNRLLTIGTICNHARVAPDPHGLGWQVIGDPTEGALIVAAMKAGIGREAADGNILSEIPFDSERKMMSVIIRKSKVNTAAGSTSRVGMTEAGAFNSRVETDAAGGTPSHDNTSIFTKGAPEFILDRCTQELFEGTIQALSTERKREIQRQSSELADRALRVLALAWRDDPKLADGQYLEDDLVFAGVVGMIDPPRDEVKKAVAECHLAGIRPVMITGDHPATALAIGRELNIASDNCLAVTGQELDSYSDQRLTDEVERIAVYARVSAAHKLRVVQAWKARHQVVAMTGDGVNDAPAVKAADIGIAMGITGTDVTKEAADMVLTDDNFASIVSAIREGRGIFDNIQKFVHYLLSCNAGEVMLMFAAAVMGLPLPLIAVQILWINLVTDGLPALALAMEPPERDIMQRKPRPPREPVITWQAGTLIIYHGVLIAASAFLGFWWACANDPADSAVARTVAFAITAFSQLAFALVCRSQRYTLPRLGLFSNHWLFVAFAVSGLLQMLVLTVPFAQQIFDVVPMPINLWLIVIGLSLLPATVIELAKIGKNAIASSRREPLPTESGIARQGS